MRPAADALAAPRVRRSLLRDARTAQGVRRPELRPLRDRRLDVNSDADWNNYLAQLEALKVDRFVEILQIACDRMYR